MANAQTNIGEATRNPDATPSPRASKVQPRTYIVYTVEDNGEVLRRLGTAESVTARGAIAEVAGDRDGTYAAVSERAYNEFARKTETRTVSQWS